jgi:hypothetical protein
MVLALLMTPEADTFLQLISNGKTYSNIWLNLFPNGMWFNL